VLHARRGASRSAIEATSFIGLLVHSAKSARQTVQDAVSQPKNGDHVEKGDDDEHGKLTEIPARSARSHVRRDVVLEGLVA
jgi:hypothetical protein